MNQEITERIEDNDPIGNLRTALNQEFPERDKFHKFYNQLKNLPMFFEIAKKRVNQ